MLINKKELLLKLNQLMPGLASGKTILDGTDCIVFASSKLHTYNNDISITVDFETGIRGTVNGKDLFKLIKKIKKDEVDLVEDEDCLLILAGKTKAKLKFITADVVELIDALNILGKPQKDSKLR